MKIKNNLEIGKNYRIINRFDKSNPDINIEFDTLYFGEINCIKGIYHIFIHKGQEASVNHCYIPSKNSFIDIVRGSCHSKF